VASNLAPLVNLVQGFIELSAKMLVLGPNLGVQISSNLGVGCEWFKARWVGSKNLEAMLGIALEGLDENFASYH
jgi:hypothetical protein